MIMEKAVRILNFTTHYKEQKWSNTFIELKITQISIEFNATDTHGFGGKKDL